MTGGGATAGGGAIVRCVWMYCHAALCLLPCKMPTSIHEKMTRPSSTQYEFGTAAQVVIGVKPWTTPAMPSKTHNPTMLKENQASHDGT